MTTDTVDVSSTLLDAVVVKLQSKTDKGLMDLWRNTDIPYPWLRKVRGGEIENPGVKRIQFLYEYFYGRKLNV